MKKLLIPAATIAGIVFAAAPAQAMIPEHESTASTECGGNIYDEHVNASMFCAENDPARAEGPYSLTFVAEVDGKQQFCQTVRFTPANQVQTCAEYYPFTNPVINADKAPASAFDETYVSPERAQRLEARVAKKNATIQRLRDKLRAR